MFRHEFVAHFLQKCQANPHILLFSLRHGTRRWGGYFVLALLTAIPILSVSAGILTAFLPYALGGVFNMQGMLLGDPSGMPDYATYATGAVVVIGVSLCFLLKENNRLSL